MVLISPIQFSTLDCGLRVITECISESRSSSIGVWVNVGSRDENSEEWGAAHFLEHILFKGTNRRSGKEIAKTIDAIGGEINAFTSKEYTCFYSNVLSEHTELGLDIITDVVFNGICDKKEIELERNVILEEISMHKDDLEDYTSEILFSNILSDHVLSNSIIGSESSIRDMDYSIIKNFHRKWYVPQRIVIAVAGNVSHEFIVNKLKELFVHLPNQEVLKPRIIKSLPKENKKVLSFIEKKRTNQFHFSMGYQAPYRESEDRYAAMLISTILGGGVSSKLFQIIREEQALAYTIYSQYEAFTDAGVFYIYAATSFKEHKKLCKSISQILKNIIENGFSEEEITIAKGSLKGNLILGLEDPNSRMLRIGRHQLQYDRFVEIDETISKIDQTSLAHINDLAKKIFNSKPLISVIGDIKSKKRTKSFLNSNFV